MPITAGYDIGGAHLKVALADGRRTVAVRQIPCPLWRGIDALDAALAEADALTVRADVHAATMTGELCEAFTDRLAGVAAILDRLEALRGRNVRVWMGARGLGSLGEARAHPLDVASTNFLASAVWISSCLPSALLIDMGSTTTDIIPIIDGRAAPRGLNDGDRLRTGELVYTGTTRSDVATVARRARLDGIVQRLAAGSFASMADVRRVLGTLPPDVDQHPTLDGRGKSRGESLERFARCFGRDASDATDAAWVAAASDIARQQMNDIADAARTVMENAGLRADVTLVAAGIGAGEVALLAGQLDLPCTPFGALAAASPDCAAWATHCAPATALALIAANAYSSEKRAE